MGESMPLIKISGKSRKGIIKFIKGPAKSIICFLYIGKLSKLLSGSIVSLSAISLMCSPCIFTYPPKGSNDREYSVSPILNLNNFGPNPIEKFSTFTFAHFAANRWPSSCTNIKKLIINKKTIIVMEIIIYIQIQRFKVNFSVCL